MGINTAEYPHVYLSEGHADRGPSKHKAIQLSRILRTEVATVGVRGPEPSHISMCDYLLDRKRTVFSESRQAADLSLAGRQIEWVADVTVALGEQGGPFAIDLRKEPVRARDGKTRETILSEKIASLAAQFGDRTVVVYLDAGITASACDYDADSTVVASAIARSYLHLPGNPLQYPNLIAGYIRSSGLGDLHYDALPGGIDFFTLAAYLEQIGWYGRWDFALSDALVLPYGYEDESYIEESMQFYADRGRIPSDLPHDISPAGAVEAMDHAFNFSPPLVHAVLGALDGRSFGKPGTTVTTNTIYARPRTRARRG